MICYSMGQYPGPNPNVVAVATDAEARGRCHHEGNGFDDVDQALMRNLITYPFHRLRLLLSVLIPINHSPSERINGFQC
jgi:hypothetical protein